MPLLPGKSARKLSRFSKNACDRLHRMAPEGPQDISALVTAWSKGDQEALNRTDYCCLPGAAANCQAASGRRPTDHTLESAALANEAYLKLIRARGLHCENRVHFFALCAQMIRRILVDHARYRRYAKRGGDAVQVPLDEALLGTRARGVEVMALDEALESLRGSIPARRV